MQPLSIHSMMISIGMFKQDAEAKNAECGCLGDYTRKVVALPLSDEVSDIVLQCYMTKSYDDVTWRSHMATLQVNVTWQRYMAALHATWHGDVTWRHCIATKCD